MAGSCNATSDDVRWRWAGENLFQPSRVPTSGYPRMPAVMGGAMVATSHPLATRAGVRALEKGGNAIDAAISAAAAMTVCEPSENGPGGDAFALVWRDGQVHGVNGSGRAPRELNDDRTVAEVGPRSVTVPGAVSLWAELAERFGRLGLDRCLEDGIALASAGVVATPRVANLWCAAEATGRAPWPAPGVGERYVIPGLALTLRAIAQDGPTAFYEGPIAQAIAGACWLSLEDLARHRTEWVEPIVRPYRGVEVCELPPNGHGVAALLALGIVEGLRDGKRQASLHHQIEAIKVAMADAQKTIGDCPLPPEFLADERIAALRAAIGESQQAAQYDEPPRSVDGNTVYLCCVDEERCAVSFIQSIYDRFGSGVLAGDTGVVLHNRASCFVSEQRHPNALGPERRPYHTIMPGMLLQSGSLLGPFGVMGGLMQPQGHTQIVQHVIDQDADPQQGLDLARFKVESDGTVLLEPGLAEMEKALQDRGHRVVVSSDPHPFGVGQMILTLHDALVGGSDERGDGYVGGY